MCTYLFVFSSIYLLIYSIILFRSIGDVCVGKASKGTIYKPEIKIITPPTPLSLSQDKKQYVAIAVPPKNVPQKNLPSALNNALTNGKTRLFLFLSLFSFLCFYVLCIITFFPTLQVVSFYSLLFHFIFPIIDSSSAHVY